jgi:hypothetical protein
MMHQPGLSSRHLDSPAKSKRLCQRRKGYKHRCIKPALWQAYAYVFELRDYNAHKAIFMLQQGGVMVQSAFRSFTTNVNGKPKSFGYGSISIPVNLQRIAADSIYKLVTSVSGATGIDIFPLETGLRQGGIDMGSGFLRTLEPPKVMMLIAQALLPPKRNLAFVTGGYRCRSLKWMYLILAG